MIELFQTMLAGVAAAALCGGAALALTRGSALREVIRLAGGLAILLAVLQPLTGIRLPDLAGKVEQALQNNAAQSTMYAQQNEQALTTAAVHSVTDYIEQRASQLGVSCTADAAVEREADSGRTVLTGLTLTASAEAQSQTEAVESMILSECGIPKELVTWNWTD